MFGTKVDFLAIGDVTVDAFIRLKEARVTCDSNKENCKLCFSYGQKVPYESVEVVPAVGNSANASVCAAKLGLKSALMSNVGDDADGKDCLSALKEKNVITKYVKINSGKKTNYHYVLWYEDERTILVKHEEYDYDLPKKMPETKWIYLSSLAENSLIYHKQITDYLKNHPEIKLAFQPGTFQIKLGYESISDVYKRAEIIFCNKEEAQKILNSSDNSVAVLAKSLFERGPKMAVVTDGLKGAYLFDGRDSWFVPTYPDPRPAVNRTGAGDSFAATFTSALALGKTPQEALMWAPINAMSVVQKVGAQKGLLKMSELQEFLNKAPESYKVRKI